MDKHLHVLRTHAHAIKWDSAVLLGLFRVPTSAEEEREKEIVMDGYMLMNKKNKKKKKKIFYKLLL